MWFTITELAINLARVLSQFTACMKKLISVIFTVMIVLSGLHFSIATHLCGDELDWTVSWSQEKASCGMCAHSKSVASPTITPEDCCKDYFTLLSVDTNYQPSECKIPAASVFTTPLFVALLPFEYMQPDCTSLVYANIHPPGNYLPTDVTLPDICVFRI